MDGGEVDALAQRLTAIVQEVRDVQRMGGLRARTVGIRSGSHLELDGWHAL